VSLLKIHTEIKRPFPHQEAVFLLMAMCRLHMSKDSLANNLSGVVVI